MILDTTALSAFVDGDSAVGDILRTQARAVIPVIVLGEFHFGITGSRHRIHYERWLIQNLPQFETLNVTADTAATYAAIRAILKRAGTSKSQSGSASSGGRPAPVVGTANDRTPLACPARGAFRCKGSKAQ